MLENFALVFITIFIIVRYIMILLENQKRRFYGKPETLPPGKLGLPVLGETIKLALEKVEFFRRRRHIYGRVFKTHLFGQPVIRVTGKENVRKIISGENKIVESCYPLSIRKLLGPNALAMSKGLNHKCRKEQVMHFFSKDFLCKHKEPFRCLINEYLLRWSGESSVDIYVECRSLFIEIAAKYLIGMEISSSINRQIKTLYEEFTANMFGFPINVPGFSFHKAVRAKKRLLQIFSNLTREKRDDDSTSVLQAYRKVREGEESQGIEEATLELLWNASETVSSAAFVIVYHLSRNPKILSKLQNELRHGAAPTMEAGSTPISTTSYTDCVVREALRVMPPVGGAYRKAIQSFEVEGYLIPKDWTIIFGIRDTHENDEALDDPRIFNPNRWLEENKKSFAYLPFGGGVRVCPGQNYARMILKLFTEQLCNRYSFNMLTQDPELELFPSPKPKNSLQVSFSEIP